jgi:deoxyribodipyrimidine photo-lyase
VTVAIVVFTRDLRVRDHPALVAASDARFVVPLFVLDGNQLHGRHDCANRVRFLLDSLTDLDTSLRERGGALVVRRGNWVEEVSRVARECRAGEVHLSADVSHFASARLDALRRAGAQHGFSVTAHPGVTVVPPGALNTGSGTPYQVFTPFYRRWVSTPWRDPLAVPASVALPDGIESSPLPALSALTAGTVSPQLAPGGERAGLLRMREWAGKLLARYADNHDDVAADATSRCSAYLHFGCVSPLEVATRLRGRPGGDAFVRQLAWRDFFHQLLATRPALAWEDMRPRGTPSGMADEAFAAWCAGRTGYPLVDAGLRQLRAEGFMHNRVRMVVASFLTKDLDVPWQLGARYFMSLLVDGDVANNQLNWQWVAGTGTDANPHRVFNPIRQSERFDPDGIYIKRYVNELRELDPEAIHDPSGEQRTRCGYPAKLVDHADAVSAYRARLSASR